MSGKNHQEMEGVCSDVGFTAKKGQLYIVRCLIKEEWHDPKLCTFIFQHGQLR